MKALKCGFWPTKGFHQHTNGQTSKAKAQSSHDKLSRQI